MVAAHAAAIGPFGDVGQPHCLDHLLADVLYAMSWEQPSRPEMAMICHNHHQLDQGRTHAVTAVDVFVDACSRELLLARSARGQFALSLKAVDSPGPTRRMRGSERCAPVERISPWSSALRNSYKPRISACLSNAERPGCRARRGRPGRRRCVDHFSAVKIATFNINKTSRRRLPNLLAWLASAEPGRRRPARNWRTLPSSCSRSPSSSVAGYACDLGSANEHGTALRSWSVAASRTAGPVGASPGDPSDTAEPLTPRRRSTAF